MAKIIGKVGVDTGSFLIIDPCYLFTTREWTILMSRREVLEARGVEPDAAYRQVIFDAVAKRSGVSVSDSLGALVTNFGGDGCFEVEESDNGIEVVL